MLPQSMLQRLSCSSFLCRHYQPVALNQLCSPAMLRFNVGSAQPCWVSSSELVSDVMCSTWLLLVRLHILARDSLASTSDLCWFRITFWLRRFLA